MSVVMVKSEDIELGVRAILEGLGKLTAFASDGLQIVCDPAADIARGLVFFRAAGLQQFITFPPCEIPLRDDE